jgi:hypothetical protein
VDSLCGDRVTVSMEHEQSIRDWAIMTVYGT